VITTIAIWGAAAGLFHFVLIALLYGNPIADRLAAKYEPGSPACRVWASKPKYFVTQFFGTQVEVYILTTAFIWLRPSIDLPGYAGALALGALLAATRVYPRFWNMWIQTTYPRPLLAVEVVNGTVGTVAIILFLQAVTPH
jgi:hypothetical protein